MHVREQDLAAEVDDVDAVEDADADRPHEHHHRHLEEEHDLPPKRMGGVCRRHLGHRFPPVPANGATIRAPPIVQAGLDAARPPGCEPGVRARRL